MMRLQDHEDSKALNELSSMILNMLRSPSDQSPSSPITPAGFAAMMVGVSTAMMLCGSVTFWIGFFLMPWVLGLVITAYLIGVVSSFFVIWRTVFFGCSFSPFDSIRKEVSAWKLS